MRLEQIEQGMALAGVIPQVAVQVLAVNWHGGQAVGLVYADANGRAGQTILYRDDEAALSEAAASRRPLDADPLDFKLAAEAQRIQRAGLYDPMLAIATSDVQPLPHQIEAVYGEMLPKRPLRYLLADDPGAGKTIMAGLLIKELMLRDDVRRCLIVAPGGLVEQWQEELTTKFGLRFEILVPSALAPLGEDPFAAHPLLIARMDQLARSEELLEHLERTEWDLVVVDEAHRMSAKWYGGRLNKTRRFGLGTLLGRLTRHLLLMTATPHAGVEDDFQAFLSLIDADRFAGRAPGQVARRRVDTSSFMRRMLKEELLTFEGTPLFPERHAQTVPYRLSAPEQHLYDEVTAYVRKGMGRAERLDSSRRRTVGFALTVLQRRLASSPAAIHESLLRRTARLQRRADDLARGVGVAEEAAYLDAQRILAREEDDWSAEEAEEAEEELVDAATAARTEAELRTEIAELEQLANRAGAVRGSGQDVKWTELRTILEGNVLFRPDGRSRKLIIFTEHKDTLDYLVNRIRQLLGRPEAVEAMHGGVRRTERRRIAEEFTNNPECQVLVATDAAGEGLNLQAAHLMVNYDLPWNPNRIEQRFGRIHRIGQTEVCRLWNLVAATTREGEVFRRLLAKVAEQRQAYRGKVFDVLGGQVFDGKPLRELLLEAIRHGELPEVRARMEQVVDAGVAGSVQGLMEQALAREVMSAEKLAALRQQMDEARARRLQPYYIEMAFRAAFERLGGRMARREKGRFEISRVPSRLLGRRVPVASRYERVTFELDRVEHPSGIRADLLAPGHPLHDAVLAAVLKDCGQALDRGTVLVSDAVTEPVLLIGVQQEIVDGTGEVIDRRFGYAFADEEGQVSPAGVAPYLDCAAAPEGPVTERARELSWLGGVEQAAVSWLIEHELPDYLAEVAPRRRAELEQACEQVRTRLRAEVNRLGTQALEAQAKEDAGMKPRDSSAILTRRAEDLDRRREERVALIEKQLSMRTPPPRVVSAAVVVPATWLAEPAGEEVPVDFSQDVAAQRAVERRAVEAALAAERALGREPTEMVRNNKGYDIRSVTPDGRTIFLEVKGRIAGADNFVVTHSEVMTGKNTAGDHRLVMVRVDPRGPDFDELRYLGEAFVDLALNIFVQGVILQWEVTWEAGGAPF